MATDTGVFSLKAPRGKVIFHSIDFIPVSKPTPALVMPSALPTLSLELVHTLGSHRCQFVSQKNRRQHQRLS